MSSSTELNSLSKVTLGSIFVETLLYGLFISLYISSTTILLKQSRKSIASGRNRSKFLLFVSTLMLILATIHVGVDLRRVFDGFITHVHSEGGSEAYLSQVSSVTYIVKSTAYALQTLVGDAFIIYRLHLVWNGDKRVVFPILMCFTASIGVAIGVLQSFGRASPTEPVFVKELQQWIASFFSLTLATNFSSTLLIAFRIWWTHFQTRNIQIEGRSLSPAAVIVIESGSIYSICLVILLALYLSENYAEYVALDAVTQVIGVVFSLVIVRVALGISSDAISTQGRLTTFRPRDIGRGADSMPITQDSMIYSIKPLSVGMTTVTDVHEDVSRA